LNASLRQQVFQALTIRTAMTEDYDLQVPLPVEVIQVSQRRGRDEHKLFLENRFFQEISMVNRAGNECAIEPVGENVLDKAATRSRGDD
jgi:hypothetical protein